MTVMRKGLLIVTNRLVRVSPVSAVPLSFSLLASFSSLLWFYSFCSVSAVLSASFSHCHSSQLFSMKKINNKQTVHYLPSNNLQN